MKALFTTASMLILLLASCSKETPLDELINEPLKTDTLKVKTIPPDSLKKDTLKTEPCYCSITKKIFGITQVSDTAEVMGNITISQDTQNLYLQLDITGFGLGLKETFIYVGSQDELPDEFTSYPYHSIYNVDSCGAVRNSTITIQKKNLTAQKVIIVGEIQLKLTPDGSGCGYWDSAFGWPSDKVGEKNGVVYNYIEYTLK